MRYSLKGKLRTEDTLHPTKAVAPMQACAVHLRDRTPNWVALPGRRMGVATARPSVSVRLATWRTNVLAVGRFGADVFAC